MRVTSLGVSLMTLFALAVVPSAPAFHTSFSYAVDRFELDGNSHGVLDETPGFVDDFDGGPLLPDWLLSFGTAYESDGRLVLSSPGAHFPSPDGAPLDLTIVAGQRWVHDGAGDFVATAFWDAPVWLPPGHHFHLSAFTYASGVSGFFHETFGVGLQNLPTGFGIEQHRTEFDLANGIFRNTFTDVFPIEPAAITGQIGLRVAFDDATNVATTAFSLDGGATWTSPFAGAEIFVGRDRAQFLLSADPAVVTTTTTTVTTTSSSTTLPPMACDPAACRGSTARRSSRLFIKARAGDRAGRLSWKLERGEATEFDDFGAPTESGAYEICIGDGGFFPVLEVNLPGGGTCGGEPCWQRLGREGYRYEDAAGAVGGIRLVTLEAGMDGRTRIAVEAKGKGLEGPFLPADLPVTVRLRVAGGPCWAATFSHAGVRRNTPRRLVGKSD